MQKMQYFLRTRFLLLMELLEQFGSFYYLLYSTICGT